MDHADWPDWVRKAWETDPTDFGSMFAPLNGSGVGPPPFFIVMMSYDITGIARPEKLRPGEWLTPGYDGRLNIFDDMEFQITYEPVEEEAHA